MKHTQIELTLYRPVYTLAFCMIESLLAAEKNQRFNLATSKTR